MYLIQPETPPTRTRLHSPSLRPKSVKQAVPLLRRMISFALAVGASYRIVFLSVFPLEMMLTFRVPTSVSTSSGT